jgi:hypothetical protein
MPISGEPNPLFCKNVTASSMYFVIFIPIFFGVINHLIEQYLVVSYCLGEQMFSLKLFARLSPQKYGFKKLSLSSG